MGKAGKRLASLKALLGDAHRRMGLEFGFRLWDGAGERAQAGEAVDQDSEGDLNGVRPFPPRGGRRPAEPGG